VGGMTAPEAQKDYTEYHRKRDLREQLIEQLGAEDLRLLLRMIAMDDRGRVFDGNVADFASLPFAPRDLLTGMLYEIGPR